MSEQWTDRYGHGVVGIGGEKPSILVLVSELANCTMYREFFDAQRAGAIWRDICDRLEEGGGGGLVVTPCGYEGPMVPAVTGEAVRGRLRQLAAIAVSLRETGRKAISDRDALPPGSLSYRDHLSFDGGYLQGTASAIEEHLAALQQAAPEPAKGKVLVDEADLRALIGEVGGQDPVRYCYWMTRFGLAPEPEAPA